MGFGRFVCVAVPFGLTIASLVCTLIVMLSGITSHNLDMFDVTTKDLSISSSSLANFADEVTKRSDLGHLVNAGLNGVTDGVNFTASDLGLADSYKVYMWNYCSQTGSNSTCTKAKFNWAQSALNTTAINERAQEISTKVGKNATLPKDVTAALKTYSTVSKWTQVVYIIAFILIVLELVVGLFGFCSRAGSCITYFVAGLASTAIIGASILATASSSIVVAAVKTTSRAYGVKANIETGFLSTTWLAVAFSIGASLFWMFSICCCKAEHRNKNNNEKFAARPGSYQPLHDPNTAYQGQQQGVYNMQNTQKPVRGGAYEPYAHAAV